MSRSCAALAALFLAASASAGEQASPADQLAAIQKAHKEAAAAFYKVVRALPDTPEGNQKYQDLWKPFAKAQEGRLMAAVELARGSPKSEAGFAALEWVLTIPRTYHLSAGKPALELATKYHAANPKVGKIVAWVGYYLPPEPVAAHAAAVAFIKAVAEKNPDRTARGQAVMALAWVAKGRFEQAEYKKAPDVEKRAAADADQRAAEAEKAFEVVLKDYADCPRLMGKNAGTLGEEAKRELFELRHLRVGKVAPEIAGEDLDGVPFKLSDYRGKVVVLDFWGDW